VTENTGEFPGMDARVSYRPPRVPSKGSSKYMVIAEHFETGVWKGYDGWVIASSDALFLAIDERAAGRIFAQLGGRLAGAGLGIFGAVIVGAAAGYFAAWEEKKSRAPANPRPGEFDLSELPDSITHHPDWPLFHLKGRVMVIPRASVISAKYPWWGGLSVKTENETILISPNFWKRKRVVRFLQKNGWESDQTLLEIMTHLTRYSFGTAE